MPLLDKVAFKAKSIKIEPTCIQSLNIYLLDVTIWNDKWFIWFIKLQWQLWNTALRIWKISGQKSNNIMDLINKIKKLGLIFWQIHKIYTLMQRNTHSYLEHLQKLIMCFATGKTFINSQVENQQVTFSDENLIKLEVNNKIMTKRKQKNILEP